ncbi:MAG: cache and HAMP domain-containing protein, partial [Methanospirillum sp.]|nr:cache and HAMP domain-containing protein [Methanospirillum sp.]
MSQGKISVTIKILFLFLVIAIITLGFSVFIGFPLIEEIGRKASVSSIDLGEKAVEDSSQALLQSAERELLSLAQDKAELSNYYFSRSENNLKFLYQVVKQEMDIPASGTGHVYGNDSPPADPKTSSLLHAAPNASPGTNEEVGYLSDMDKYFLPLYGTNADLDSIYIGTDTGYILVHPWTDTIPATYDPRVRPWYIDAMRTGDITWIGPYVDSSSNTLMMTGAIPIRSEAKNFSWVIGLDVRVDTINQIINSTDSGGEGYAILIDKNGDIISKPGLSTKDTRWDEIYSAENLLESDNPSIVSAGRNMTGGKTGVERVSMADGESIIAYAPIASTGWSIGIVRPLSSILAPVIRTEADIRNETAKTATTISDNKQTVLSMYLAGSLILLFFISLIAVVFARYITRPIGVLMDATRVIGSGDLSKKVDLHTGDEFEELGSLFNR